MATTYQYSVEASAYSLEFNITPNSGPLGSNSKLTVEGKVTYVRAVQNDNLYLEFRPTGSSDSVPIGSVFRFRTFSSHDTSTRKVSTFTQTITISQSRINSVFALLSGTPTSATIRVRFSAEGRYTSNYPTDLSYTLYKQRVNPSLSNPAFTDRHPAISGTDTPYEFFGGFVQGESLPRFETDFALDSQFPAMTARHTLVISQDDVEVLTLTQTTAAGVTHVAFDLDAFTATGQFTLGYTLKDGAGNTATLIAQFTVYAYSPPSVTSFLMERYRTIPGGTELADDGEYAWLTLAGEVASVNSLNATTVTLTYSHDGGTETSVTVTTGTDGKTLAYTRDATTLSGVTFDARYTYDFVLTVTDMLHTVTMTGSIYKAGGFFCIEKFGVAVGKRATNDPNDKRFDVDADYTSHFGGEVYAEGGIAGVTNYSSGEVATGGTWIDGKPIYRYVYHNSAFNTTASTSAMTVHTVPSDMESIVNIYGTAITNGIAYPLTYYQSDTNSQWCWARNHSNASDPNTIAFRHTYTTARTYDLTVILEYTKPTT